mmetsp:Transcript_503/g.498  ORF Transcript_503/g.498 Transcript_503/m.498 type:complete len:81 (-) Transcript_503:8-250(-)
MDYHCSRELTAEEQTAELEANLDRGNHKSATSKPERIQKLLEKDAKHGFAMPVPISSVMNLKDAMVQPIGLANQFSLQAD